ncbi:MAG: hypothetical protein JWM61_1533 [Micrococcaceae bacterium]|jgi:hypothetical protein|nr:hypothetical protein [Micrococcaceae bacterium]
MSPCPCQAAVARCSATQILPTTAATTPRALDPSIGRPSPAQWTCVERFSAEPDVRWPMPTSLLADDAAFLYLTGTHEIGRGPRDGSP